MCWVRHGTGNMTNLSSPRRILERTKALHWGSLRRRADLDTVARALVG